VAAFHDGTACARTFCQDAGAARPVRAGVAAGAAGVKSGTDHVEACEWRWKTGSCGEYVAQEVRGRVSRDGASVRAKLAVMERVNVGRRWAIYGHVIFLYQLS
jgi:hypothetical protein